MTRIRWLALFIACLLMGQMAPLPFNHLSGIDRASASEQGSTTQLKAAYVGKTVIKTTELLTLHLLEEATPARDKLVLTDIKWELQDKVAGTSPELVTSLPKPGDYTVRLSYSDLQSNTYETKINVRVMEPDEYDKMMAAVYAAANLPLWLEDEELFLPIVSKSLGRRD